LESAYKLLEIENPHGAEESVIAPVDHHFSIGQILQGSYMRFYANKGLAFYLQRELSLAARGLVEFSVIVQNTNLLALIQNIQINQQTVWQDNSIPEGIYKEKNSINIQLGLFLKTEITPEILGKLKTIEELETHLANSGLNLNNLLVETGIERQQSLLGILLTDTTGTLYFYIVISGDSRIYGLRKVESEGAFNNPRLSTDLYILSTKSVAIIGLGSLGSKVALSLTRTGVGKFYFIDEDIFLPDNVCRNALDWRSVGQHKVHAVKEQISYISSPQIETSTVNLVGQETNAALDDTLHRLQQYDILIDATANPKVFNLLASVTKTYHKPLIWGEIFAGGIGGMIARSRPDKDISPIGIRNAYYEYLFSQNAPFLDSRPTNPYTVETHDGEVLTASDAEVDIIAGHLTRFAVDILLERESSLFPYSLYLIGLKAAWVFREPFYTIPIDTSDLSEQEGNPASPPALSQDVIQDNINFLEQMFDAQSNNADSSS
jgi:molybdopterin/thiamine biosynthesis adenylyltransferase